MWPFKKKEDEIRPIVKLAADFLGHRIMKHLYNEDIGIETYSWEERRSNLSVDWCRNWMRETDRIDNCKLIIINPQLFFTMRIIYVINNKIIEMNNEEEDLIGHKVLELSRARSERERFNKRLGANKKYLVLLC